MKKLKRKSRNTQVLCLWQHYQNVHFEWNSTPLASTEFAIITAYNPKGKITPPNANRLRQQKLLRYLNSRDICFASILAGDPGFSHVEPSYALALPQAKSINLAQLYQQNAIYWVKDGQLQLIPVLLTGLPTVTMREFQYYLENRIS